MSNSNEPLRRRLATRRSRSLIALLAVPLAGALVFGMAAARTPSATSSSLTLEASLSARTLTIMRDEETVKTYDVAIGKDASPTPAGAYNIKRVVWNPSWVPPDAKWARGKSAKRPSHRP